jgi:hypothetical protein
MKRRHVNAIVILHSIVMGLNFAALGSWGQDPSLQDPGLPSAQATSDNAAAVVPSPASLSVQSKRDRAKLLHETLHGALSVMHRDFFSEETSRILPSQSLLSVFSELKRSHGVEVRWMTVSGDEMNEDHRPTTPFELEAVARIKQGAEFHESIDDDAYRYIGRIRLASECLKCHVSRRRTTDDRASGLSITIKNRVKNSDPPSNK